MNYVILAGCCLLFIIFYRDLILRKTRADKESTNLLCELLEDK